MAQVYYPVMLDVTDRCCVVVGGGRVAWQKASSLLEAAARVRVVAPQVCDELRVCDLVTVTEAAYSPAVLDGAFLVVSATDSAEVNARVFADCRRRGILCNVVDRPEQCDFIVPSVLRRGPLTVAVSTAGASPHLAGRIRRRLEGEFDAAWGPYLETLARARAAVHRGVSDEAVRREAALALACDDLLEAARRGAETLNRAVAEVLARYGVAFEDESDTTI